MAADLFETYVVTVVATMVLAAIFFAGTPQLVPTMFYPLAICAACIVTSIAGTFFVKLGPTNSIMGALYKGLIATGLLSIVGLAIATQFSVGWAPSASFMARRSADCISSSAGCSALL